MENNTRKELAGMIRRKTVATTPIRKIVAALMLAFGLLVPVSLTAASTAYAAETPARTVVLAEDYNDPAPNDTSSGQGGNEKIKGTKAKSTVSIAKDNGDLQSVVDSINKASKKDWLEYDPAQGYVTFDSQSFNRLDVKSRNNYMETAVSAVRTSSLSNMFKNKFYGFLKGQDSSAYEAAMRVQRNTSVDIEQGMNMLRGFGVISVVSVILGLLVIFIWIGVVWVTLCDVAVLLLPVLRWGWLNPVAADGGYKRGFVSHSAYKAIKKTEIDGSTDQPELYIYFKDRLVFVAFALFTTVLLVSGDIHMIFAILADMVSPLIDSVVSGFKK